MQYDTLSRPPVNCRDCRNWQTADGLLGICGAIYLTPPHGIGHRIHATLARDEEPTELAPGALAEGDRVRATVPAGKKAGSHAGRVAVRASGRFNLQTPAGLVQGIGYRYCTLLHRADGYGYTTTWRRGFLPGLKAGVSAAKIG